MSARPGFAGVPLGGQSAPERSYDKTIEHFEKCVEQEIAILETAIACKVAELEELSQSTAMLEEELLGVETRAAKIKESNAAKLALARRSCSGRDRRHSLGAGQAARQLGLIAEDDEGEASQGSGYEGGEDCAFDSEEVKLANSMAAMVVAESENLQLLWDTLSEDTASPPGPQGQALLPTPAATPGGYGGNAGGNAGGQRPPPGLRTYVRPPAPATPLAVAPASGATALVGNLSAGQDPTAIFYPTVNQPWVPPAMHWTSP